MRGRLTIDKVNAAINDMAAYAEANAQLIAAPKKKVPSKFCLVFAPPISFFVYVLTTHHILKVGENHWDKALVCKLLPIDLRCSFKYTDCNLEVCIKCTTWHQLSF